MPTEQERRRWHMPRRRLGTRYSAEGRQRLSPTSHLSDDAIRICGPDERLRTFVGLRQKTIYGRLEVDDPAKGASLQPLAGKLGEEALDRVQPGCRRRGEVKVKSRVPWEPSTNLGMLEGGVVMDNQMQVQVRRGSAIDLLEEANELLVPVSTHALADHSPIQHVERGEQGCRAVTLIVMGHRLAASRAQGEPRLSAIERLDLRLLVDR